MKSLLIAFMHFFESPTGVIIQAAILLLSSGFEIFEITTSELLGFDIGGHHGIALFGVIKLVDAIGEIVEKKEHMAEAVKTIKERHRA